MTGGDRFRLDSEYLDFVTDNLLLDQAAMNHATKYIKKMDISDQEIVVSLGPMSIYTVSFTELQIGQKKFFNSSQETFSHQHVVIHNK